MARPLSRDRILQAAVSVADDEGLAAVTMRRLGAELGVEAMSLYKHVANKDAILDGMVDLVVSRIDLPDAEMEWKDAMRARARSARVVLSRHSWAVGLMEAHPSHGPATLRYLDAVIGSLRAGGFTIEDAAHAFWLLDNHVYGQIIQEASITSGPVLDVPDPGARPGSGADDHPHLAELAQHARRSHHSPDDEFEFGLELVLDALERLLD